MGNSPDFFGSPAVEPEQSDTSLPRGFETYVPNVEDLTLRSTKEEGACAPRG